MKHEWFTGCGQPITHSAMLEEINCHVSHGGKVFVGSDSQLKSDSCVFATAICLHGSQGQKGGRYFFRRFKTKKFEKNALRERIVQEVHHSINIALDLFQNNPSAEIEVHLDVGTGPKSLTREYAESLKGWALSTGFKCEVKPNAWASASVADKHTK